MTEQKLRVWWVPQVPMKAFYVEVENLVEAKLILNTLARYDLFQFENRVKPDYCNVGGLQIFDTREEGGGNWIDWHDDETYEDIDSVTLEELRRGQAEIEKRKIQKAQGTVF